MSIESSYQSDNEHVPIDESDFIVKAREHVENIMAHPNLLRGMVLSLENNFLVRNIQYKTPFEGKYRKFGNIPDYEGMAYAYPVGPDQVSACKKGDIVLCEVATLTHCDAFRIAFPGVSQLSHWRNTKTLFVGVVKESGRFRGSNSPWIRILRGVYIGVTAYGDEPFKPFDTDHDNKTSMWIGDNFGRNEIKGMYVFPSHEIASIYYEQELYSYIQELLAINPNLHAYWSDSRLETLSQPLDTHQLDRVKQTLDKELVQGIDERALAKRRQLQEQIAALQFEIDEIPRQVEFERRTIIFQLEIIRALEEGMRERIAQREALEERNNQLKNILAFYGFDTSLINPYFYMYISEIITRMIQMGIIPEKMDKDDVLKAVYINGGEAFDLFDVPKYAREITPSQALFMKNIDVLLRHGIDRQTREKLLHMLKRVYPRYFHPDSGAVIDKEIAERLFKVGWSVIENHRVW